VCYERQREFIFYDNIYSGSNSNNRNDVCNRGCKMMRIKLKLSPEEKTILLNIFEKVQAGITRIDNDEAEKFDKLEDDDIEDLT